MEIKSLYNIQFLIACIKNFFILRQKRKIYQKKLINFFNLNEPCDKDTKNCNELRKKYMEELNDLQTNGGCQRCLLINLQESYVRRLIAAQQ